MKWISRQNRNCWFRFCVSTWFQILGAVLSAWCSCPPSGGVFRLSHLGVMAGYPMQTVMRFSRFNWCLAGRTWQVRFWGSKPDTVGSVRWTSPNRAYHNNTQIFRKWYFRFSPSKPEVIVPVWCDIEWINDNFIKHVFLRKFTYSASVKMQN